jgi:hypothetical protein
MKTFCVLLAILLVMALLVCPTDAGCRDRFAGSATHGGACQGGCHAPAAPTLEPGKLGFWPFDKKPDPKPTPSPAPPPPPVVVTPPVVDVPVTVVVVAPERPVVKVAKAPVRLVGRAARVALRVGTAPVRWLLRR